MELGYGPIESIGQEQGLRNAKKSIMELECALMTLKSTSKICGMHTKSRMGLGCALMTLKTKSKVCRLQKKSRMELGCRIMTLKSKSKVCGMQKGRAESS